MMPDYQPVLTLIDQIMGTVGVLSSLFLRMPGLLLTLIVLSVIVSKMLQG